MRALIARLLICLSLGALFYALTEICQTMYVRWGYDDCCERCRNYLYGRAQPVLALCAIMACFFYLWKSPASVSFRRSLRYASLFSAAGFLGYFVFMGTNIYLRTECTALYSPGPGFLHSVVFGGPLVALTLLTECAVWSSICVALLLILGLVSRVFRPADPIVSLALKT